MLLSHILWNTQNHKQKCFNSTQYEKFKIKLNISENKAAILNSRVVNGDYLWSFRTGTTVRVFLPNFSMTRHATATQESVWMTYQHFRALKGAWPKPEIATPINRSAIFNQKFKASNLCWASLVENHWGNKKHSQPRDTSPLQSNLQTHEHNPFSPLLPATLNISSAMTRFFSPSPPLPTPVSYLLSWQLVTATSLPRWLSLKPDLCSSLRPVVVPSLSHSNHFWQETCWSQQQLLAPETHWDYTGKSGYSVLSPS